MSEGIVTSDGILETYGGSKMMDEKQILFLQERAKDIRVLILDMLSNLGVGHVGGCLSIADVLSVLYFEAMNIRPEQPQWPQRDRLVLSKGHADRLYTQRWRYGAIFQSNS